jgi:hypothetical protein
MAVAPSKMQSIVAYRSNTNPLQTAGNASGKELSYAGTLIHTGSAHAFLPQIP